MKAAIAAKRLGKIIDSESTTLTSISTSISLELWAIQELRLLSLKKNYIPAAEAKAHDHAEPQTQENGGDQDDGCH